MSKPTRRHFLAMAGAAAAVGVAAAATTAGAESTSTSARTASGSGGGPLVAHVSDVHGGALSLMFGEDEVVVDDPDLVARLVRAAS